MIGTSTHAYIFIQTCIIFLHYVAPVSILYSFTFVVFSHFTHETSFRIPLPLELWMILETIFYACVYLPRQRMLQSEAAHPPPPSREERRLLFARCNSSISNPEEYLRKWFLGAPIVDIKKDNIKEFFLWAFFNRDNPPGDDEAELDEYVTAMESLLGRKLQEGRGDATCLRLTLDRVNFLHRSILWYFCVGFVDFLTSVRLSYHGFNLYHSGISSFFSLFPFRPLALLSKHRSDSAHLTYWHRKHTSKAHLPVVFIHGIGIGLYPYVNFLAELNNDCDDQIGILAVEIMPISFRITKPILKKDAMVAEILKLVEQQGWDKFVLVSHSYGTVISTHLLRSPLIADRIEAVVLIDPVCILLHLPDVAYNFTRRRPKTANEHQLHYFASMDMGISHALARCFFWSENILWKEDLGERKTTISLAQKDLIVNTEAVGRYLATTDTGNSLPNGNGHCQFSDTREHKTQEKCNGYLASTEPIASCESTTDSWGWKSRSWHGSGLDILWYDGLDHVQVFDKFQTRKSLLDVVRNYCGRDPGRV